MYGGLIRPKWANEQFCNLNYEVLPLFKYTTWVKFYSKLYKIQWSEMKTQPEISLTMESGTLRMMWIEVRTWPNEYIATETLALDSKHVWLHRKTWIWKGVVILRSGPHDHLVLWLQGNQRGGGWLHAKDPPVPRRRIPPHPAPLPPQLRLNPKLVSARNFSSLSFSLSVLSSLKLGAN